MWPAAYGHRHSLSDPVGPGRRNIKGIGIDVLRSSVLQKASQDSLLVLSSRRPTTNVIKRSPISTGKLKTFLSLHIQPINHVVYMGALARRIEPGIIISGLASRLDAFSVYPFAAWLPCNALSRTTGALEAATTQSSRTKVVSRQMWCAHDR